MPGRQLVHEVAAGPEKVPSAHAKHAACSCEVEPLGPYVPAMQGVPRHVGLPVEYVPGGQLGPQTAAPRALNVPGEQAVQLAELVAPFAAECVPAGQLEQAAEPSKAKVPETQVRHTAADVAPVTFEAVPAAHVMQLAASEAAYVPNGQAEHMKPGKAATLPGAQGEQLDAPAAAYVPTAHGCGLEPAPPGQA